jgi:hypothetical protein
MAYSDTEFAFAILSSVFAGIFALVAAHAHVRLHYAYGFECAGSGRCCRWPRIRYWILMPSALHKNHASEMFFPLLQCMLVVPLIQVLCAWRLHQGTANTANVVTLVVWQMTLTLSCVFALLSFIRKPYAVYFAHMSTASHMPVAWLFLFEGALRWNPSGDIAVSCIYVICCALQLIHPPRRLKCAVHPTSLSDYEISRRRQHPMEILRVDQSTHQEFRNMKRIAEDDTDDTASSTGVEFSAYPHGSRQSALRLAADRFARRMRPKARRGAARAQHEHRDDDYAGARFSDNDNLNAYANKLARETSARIVTAATLIPDSVTSRSAEGNAIPDEPPYEDDVDYTAIVAEERGENEAIYTISDAENH